MKKILIVLSLIILCDPLTALAQKRCPANDMGCTSENMESKVKERIDQGKREVREAAPNPIKAAQAAGRTVRDCADCAKKVTSDSIDKATTSK